MKLFKKIMTTKLNPKNKLVTLNDIEKILSRVDIYEKPKNLSYYIQAFTHKSYTIKNGNIKSFNEKVISLRKYSLEQYEFVGDSFVGKTVCLYLYNRFQYFQEGNLTRLKQRIVDCKTLASFGRFLGFQEYCLISKFMENTSGRNSDKLMEDTFEAFIFALYLDLGEQIVSKFIINIMENVVDFTQIIIDDINYKHQLLEIFQKLWNLTPNYKKISEIGPPHQKTYKMATMDYLGNIIGNGIAPTKKDAEQISSKNSIELVNDIINLTKNPGNIKVNLESFHIKESRDIITIFDTIKVKMDQEISGNDREMYDTTMKTLFSILKNHNIFRIEYYINKEQFTHTIQYKKEEYAFYKKLFLDDFKCKNYIRAYHQLKTRI
jgi:ribonuclease-3